MEIFNTSEIRPAHAELFYSRGDTHDPRLGESTAHSGSTYAKAQAVILGCPQDEGVRRNGGRVGAALAPTEIRRHLYRLTTNGVESVRLFDLGDIVPQATLEQTHAVHQGVVQRLLEDGKRVITLGGGNDIAYADCAALATVAPKFLAFNVDAHFDVRADAVCNSGTPYRQLLEQHFLAPELFCEVGYQPQVNSRSYEQYLRGLGVALCSLSELLEAGIPQTIELMLQNREECQAIFWGFDLDVVRASDAPGVSSPSPDGLTAREFCQIAEMAGEDPRTRLVEFTEVNPSHDLEARTSRLTAVAIHHYLRALATTL